jgi:large subunit ribosomal protein L15
MNLSNLRPQAGSVRVSKRLGRGTGSGGGGTATRGHKGAQSRSGYKSKAHFEGGQMPLQRRVPKFGFNNLNRVEYQPINLALLQEHAEKGTSVFDHAYLTSNRMASKTDKVKILGTGKLTSAVEVHAHAFSKSALAAIEQAGGKAVTL